MAKKKTAVAKRLRKEIRTEIEHLQRQVNLRENTVLRIKEEIQELRRDNRITRWRILGNLSVVPLFGIALALTFHYGLKNEKLNKSIYEQCEYKSATIYNPEQENALLTDFMLKSDLQKLHPDTDVALEFAVWEKYGRDVQILKTADFYDRGKSKVLGVKGFAFNINGGLDSSWAFVAAFFELFGVTLSLGLLFIYHRGKSWNGGLPEQKDVIERNKNRINEKTLKYLPEQYEALKKLQAQITELQNQEMK